MKIEGGKRWARGVRRGLKTPLPLVSVVTVVRNGEATIEQTIKSVTGQTYANIEYIIVDGGSCDGTVNIIKRYERYIDYWLSEPDQGISDAFNKGIRLSSGELVGIINADDWYELDAVEAVVNNWGGVAHFAYGGCTYITQEGRYVPRPPASDYSKTIEKYMAQIHHPTVFVKKAVYLRYGLYSEDYKYAMDYEFVLRLFKQGCIGTPMFRNIAFMRLTGRSTLHYLDVRKEVCAISIRYGLAPVKGRIYYILFLLKYAARKSLEWLRSC